MTYKIIDGKMLAQNFRKEIAQKTQNLIKQRIQPGLAVVLVGEDSASQVYVKNKIKACEEVGFYSLLKKFPKNISQEELLVQIEILNNDSKIHGVLVQLPLPKHIREHKVIEAINLKKDVDGFHVKNIGSLITGQESLKPCTPLGCMKILESIGLKDLTGKHAVVVGRSNIVGKPIAIMLLQANATVTICHSKTNNLAEITKQADILVVAIGKSKFIKADMIKQGSVIIDVGINRDKNNKLCGDVDFENCKKKSSFITPVPGGVGPMTISMLLLNTLQAINL